MSGARQGRRGAGRARVLVGLVVALGSSSLARAQAEPEMRPVGPPRITVAEEGAVVRMPMAVMLGATSAWVRIDDLPAAVDLSTLTVLDRLRDLRVLDWHRPPATPPRWPAVTLDDRAVTLTMSGEQAASAVPAVRMHLRTSLPGEKRLDLVYAVTGLTWKATYDVLLRGSLEDLVSPLSIDVEGWIELVNRTGQPFRGAMLSLIGPDTDGKPPPRKEPGLLDLDEDSALSDLWRFFPPEPPVSLVYPLPSPVDLPGESPVLISLVSVQRKPVERTLLVRAEELPSDTRSVGARPSQLIRFANAADYGRDRAVPPGRALIHVGNQRSALHQEAWFKHTPSGGEIRIDMGKVDAIRARRLDRGRSQMIGGGYEQVFEIQVENLSDADVPVWVDEHPPVPHAWALLRANQPYRTVGRRFLFSPTVPARSVLVIQYTLRVTIPDVR